MRIEDDIKKAIEVLQSGGVILYPTDTIWGLGCDATNVEAVKKIYKLKQRIDSKSMLVLIDSTAKLPNYIDQVPDMAWDLIELADKPLTIIYSNAKNLAKNLIADDGSIGIRVSRERFSKILCERFRKPIVSSSANISGEPSPMNFTQISKQLKEAVDYVVEYRQNDMEKTSPSSIIKIEENGVFKIIRE